VIIETTLEQHRWRAETSECFDLAIELQFNGPQPRFFAADAARTEPLRAEGFVGSVHEGASCNCAVHTLAPHCHGTHTECVGHVTDGAVHVSAVTPAPMCLALLISVEPLRLGDTQAALRAPAEATDSVLTFETLSRSAERWIDLPWRGLLVRTRPNAQSKKNRRYSGPCPAPYFSSDAMEWIVKRGVDSLVVDLPSLDRADDGGGLTAHRIFWGLPAGATDAAQATRSRALVTELAFIPDEAADGLYLLDLQVPAFAADAAPSRPVIYPVLEVDS
jgi:kynurenine formamidase